jgi:hypothetical protein
MGLDAGGNPSYVPRGPGAVYGSPAAALAVQKKVERYIRRRLLPAAQYEAAKRSERKVSRSGPRDTGAYRLGWETRRRVGGRGARGSAPRVELVNTTPYSGIIEQGARPFWPPLAPLLEWARRKAGALALGGHFSLSARSFTARKDGSLKFRGSASLNTEDSAEVMAFARGVQRKIARDGLPAHWIMRRHLPYARRYLQSATRRRLRELAIKGVPK